MPTYQFQKKDWADPAQASVFDDATTRALRMLGTKREAVPARKHGNIPL